jgi:hypothetical protein
MPGYLKKTLCIILILCPFGTYVKLNPMGLERDRFPGMDIARLATQEVAT